MSHPYLSRHFQQLQADLAARPHEAGQIIEAFNQRKQTTPRLFAFFASEAKRQERARLYVRLLAASQSQFWQPR